MQHPRLELCPVERLVPYANNARTHSDAQIGQIAASIERFGFTNPVLVTDDHNVLAGHGRIAAAKILGMTEVPIIKLSHLTEAECRAYILTDNKLAENAGWDQELLAIELQGLIDLDFDIDVIGFSTAEIDIALSFDHGANKTDADPLDRFTRPDDGPAVTRTGDLWQLGSQRLICGDAKDSTVLDELMRDDSGEAQKAAMLFTDPPYNVPIAGHVSGLGKHTHAEFAEASGEMSSASFTDFLIDTLTPASEALHDGGIAFVCMDWRHMQELLTAGGRVFDELKNLCVWNKSNAGMGSFYRSKHELIFVYKKGRSAHINNFGLGDQGRYRTNVWDYAGANAFGADRDDHLSMHPTVKPVAMIADAIMDCSRHGDIVLDVFGGSGSTLIAAEQTSRSARLIELEPKYCDTIIQRWEAMTGQSACHIESGSTFTARREAQSKTDSVDSGRLLDMEASQ